MSGKLGDGVRVVLVDDHVAVAQAIELALRAAGHDVHCVEPPGEWTRDTALVEAILAQRPQVVLLDLYLGSRGDATPIVGPLTDAGVRVIALAGSHEPQQWGPVLALGAETVIAKTQPLEDIREAVRRVSQGQQVMSKADRQAMITQWADHQDELTVIRKRLDLLTVRESQVLAQLMWGRSVREIASEDSVSEATVRTQVKAILAKLEVSSQLAAVGQAHQVRWRAPASLSG